MSTRQIKSKRMKTMNEFQKSLRGFKEKKKISYYKTYEKNIRGEKVYTGIIETKKELTQDNYLGGVSCFIINDEGKVLIEKRANTKINSGEIDLCSGHIDGEETPTQAMIREYVEELHNGSSEEKEKARNEAIQNLCKLDELDLIFHNRGNTRKFFIQFYTMKTKLENVTIQPEEIDSIEWVNLDEAFDLIRQGKTKFPYDERYEKIFEKVSEHYKGIKEEKVLNK